MKTDLNVCLILHSTRSYNLGVGALTVAEIELLRRISKKFDITIDITVVDFKDTRSPYVEGSDLTIQDVDRNYLLSPLGYYATVRSADLVIDVGAGDSFSDIYGFSRLARIFFMKFLVLFSGTPLVLAPQTYGPFSSSGARLLARATIGRARIVATRDGLSTEALRALGFAGKIVDSSDLALSLSYDPKSNMRDSSASVGINISGLLFAGGYSGQNDFGMTLDYPRLIRNIVRFFLKLDCSVYLVPHVTVRSGSMIVEDDYNACRIVATEFSGAHLAPQFETPSEAKQFISSLDFFVGSRMHACIAAFSSGVPVVPIAYSRKFSGLFGSLGYNRTVDGVTQSEEQVLNAISDAWYDREEVKHEIQSALNEGLRRLSKYEDALGDLIFELLRSD